MKFFRSCHPYAIVTVVFWSLAFVFTRIASQAFTVFSLGFLRYLFATLALIPVVIAARLPLPRLRDLPWFVGSGFCGFFLYTITFTKGSTLVSAASGSVLIAVAPVLTACWARLLFREKLAGFQWLAILLEFGGVGLLALLGGPLSLNQGMVWMLAAALSMSLYNLFQRRLTRTYSGLQAAAYSIFAGVLMLSVFAPGAFRELARAPLSPILNLAALGVLCSALAYATWAAAFAHAAKTSVVSNYMFITPFLTALFGFLFLGEGLDLPTALGGSVILTGVFLFQFGGTLLGHWRQVEK
ncbi:MAG TPA: DMT family transporter [Candidatus Anaerotruncus excrementipullorum]|uniref:DMT family transporter n=1 Tax=Candidatus Anaerotruncus excrementipullorum TaxID=2838465 RepID=A0A9D1WUU6_9FIRM|nr:DMT family transporter [Candidatus Anaerotruncus excrementipullorum]